MHVVRSLCVLCVFAFASFAVKHGDSKLNRKGRKENYARNAKAAHPVHHSPATNKINPAVVESNDTSENIVTFVVEYKLKLAIMNKIFYVGICLLFFAMSSCRVGDENLERAESTLRALFACYGVPDTPLLRETFPFDENYSADYLVVAERPKPYSYLWPYSGVLSALSALYGRTGDSDYLDRIDGVMLKGLDEYFDVERFPPAYASYVVSGGLSDRFYDDNVWLVIDFVDLYLESGRRMYLQRAVEAWNFVASGMDGTLGGGIYWREQGRTSKNTCSNAPAVVAAMKLFEATGDERYFDVATDLYAWTKGRLRDSVDLLYFDNVDTAGTVDRRKYSYNSGQMLQAAALLYKATGDSALLVEARLLADACFKKFFTEAPLSDGGRVMVPKRGNLWFHAVMLRGFVELYEATGDVGYVEVFDRALDHAWSFARDSSGLFHGDMSGVAKDGSRLLLDQAAMIEMFARTGTVAAKRNFREKDKTYTFATRNG